MKFAVHELAKVIHAQVIGDPASLIKGVSSFDDATKDDITFACDPKYLINISQTRAGAVIVPNEAELLETEGLGKIFLKTKNPKLSFFKLVSIFHPQKKKVSGMHPSVQIGKTAALGNNLSIGANVSIGDHVTIGNNVQILPGVYIGDEVCIGDNTRISPNVTIMDKTRIGKNCMIHAGTVIGSDGFGFAQDVDKHEKIIHTGIVLIGDDVEIGACNTIDRGTLGMTVIGSGVKTDNLVHIAHNVKIGDHSLIVAQVGIAGSTQIGKNVIIAGKAGVTGHIKIGDNAIVGPYAGVHSDVSENEIVSGIPQMPHHRWRKVVSIVYRLPEMRKKLFSIEKRLKELEK